MLGIVSNHDFLLSLSTKNAIVTRFEILKRYPNFNDAVEECLKSNGYLLLDNQCDKVTQMYETMMTRHTTMIVGPTGGGKSVVINGLCQG